ncbi:MAG: phosphoadenosine phosphosulfate reductase family protein [Granulosicoccus sp.]
MSVASQHIRSSDSHSHSELNIDSTLACLECELATACKPVASTKFSPDSAVFLHMLTSVLPDIPVIWVDTGYNTRDTLEFAAYLRSALDLNLMTYRPENSHPMPPPELDTPEHDSFTLAMKLAPFQRAIEELKPDIWLSSIRRFQSIHRSTLTAREVVKPGLVKSYPMLEWSADDVEHYRHKHALPLGPEVYDPTKGLPLRECGLHTKRWCSVESS